MKKITRKGFGGLLGALLLAMELAVLADVIAAWLGHPLPENGWLIGAAALFVGLALLPVSRHALGDEAISLLLVFVVAALLSRGYLLAVSRSERYSQVDRGKGALYAGHKVLVDVPKPGEELALAGGVMENYLRYGSEVYLLYESGTEKEETARAAAMRGISAEQVLFLERAEPTALKAVLERLEPDVILAAAQKKGGESPLIKETLDLFREQETAYQPLVLLGLTEAGPEDFYGLNLLSTQPEAAEAFRTAGGWDARLRLPVDSSRLSRSLLGCDLYTQQKLYGPALTERAEGLINGDRVFWKLGSGKTETDPDFVKITDEAGNFIYDYYIDRRGKETFPLYTSGAADQPYSVTVEGERCSAKIGQARSLEVNCPKGRQCIVTVTSGDGKYWDTVVISNPGRYYRSTMQSIERIFRHAWEEVLPTTNSWRFGQLARERLHL